MHSNNDDRTKPATFEAAIDSYMDSDMYDQEAQDFNKHYMELRKNLDKKDRCRLDQLISELYNSDMRFARYAFEQAQKSSQRDYDCEITC